MTEKFGSSLKTGLTNYSGRTADTDLDKFFPTTYEDLVQVTYFPFPQGPPNSQKPP